MIILGIDPGYEKLGFGIVKINKQQQITLIDYGVIKTRKDTPFPQRLQLIKTDLDQIITEYQPQLCGIEDLFFSHNATTAMKVAEARGVIMLAIAAANIPIIEPKPNQVKSSLCGNSKADKKQIQTALMQIFKLNTRPQPDDAADAIAIAIYAATNYFNSKSN